jgi:CheY-like chemotaxis protein
VQYRAAVSRRLGEIRETLRRCFGQQHTPEPKILVVRGSRIAGEMAKLLKRHGANIEMADRPGLFDVARRTQPALIVSDLSISGISEMEDALRLRQLLPACKVMLFSGQGLRRTSLPRESELELVRTIERLCSDPLSGQMLWLDLARFVQVAPRHRSMAA